MRKVCGRWDGRVGWVASAGERRLSKVDTSKVDTELADADWVVWAGSLSATLPLEALQRLTEKSLFATVPRERVAVVGDHGKQDANPTYGKQDANPTRIGSMGIVVLAFHAIC